MSRTEFGFGLLGFTFARLGFHNVVPPLAPKSDEENCQRDDCQYAAQADSHAYSDAGAARKAR